jgi:hypothetical protein
MLQKKRLLLSKRWWFSILFDSRWFSFYFVIPSLWSSWMKVWNKQNQLYAEQQNLFFFPQSTRTCRPKWCRIHYLLWTQKENCCVFAMLAYHILTQLTVLKVIILFPSKESIVFPMPSIVNCLITRKNSEYFSVPMEWISFSD